MFSNPRLLAKAFHRPTRVTSTITRGLSGSLSGKKEKKAKGIGSTSKDHVTRVTEGHNTQVEASKAGMAARESGDQGCATSERDPQHCNEKAKLDHPEAPDPVMGMNDERGAVSG